MTHGAQNGAVRSEAATSTYAGSPTRRGIRRVLGWLLAAALILGLGIAWSVQQGYLPPPGYGCSDVAYPPETPMSVLMDEYGESAYCARRVRGEAWL